MERYTRPQREISRLSVATRSDSGIGDVMRISIPFALTLVLAAMPLLAQTPSSALSPQAEAALQVEAKRIEAMGKDPEIAKAVAKQNAVKMSLDQIEQIDKAWIGGGEDARIRELQTNACAVRLKALISKFPAYGESFVMDNQGANVCMAGKTSDYWQGDEAKWQKSFNGGKGQSFIDKAHYDTSSKAILVQISVPVMDGAQTIGAITVGVDPSKVTASK
jgi:hypothetical protein